ncbi:MAG TPA: MarR family winged helix-turn-helix transcriptional regulator [Caldimonas sp.]|nr:MarR family winged helix-turn-helix transcriptional regulator [Caldimonas sp.]
MAASARIGKTQLQTLADFRYQLRRFLRFSERAAVEEGLTPLQYQLLLQVAGWRGRDGPTVGDLADRLQRAQHGVVALVTRCEQAGFVERRTGTTDRRRVYVCLTRLGEKAVFRVASAAWRELAALREVFRVERLSAYNDRRDTRAEKGERRP